MRVSQGPVPSSHSFPRSHVSVKRQSQVKSHVPGKLLVQWVRRVNQAVCVSQVVRFCQARCQSSCAFQSSCVTGLRFRTFAGSFRAPSRTSIRGRFRARRGPEEPSGHFGLRNLPQVDVLEGVREPPANHPKWMYWRTHATSFVQWFVSGRSRCRR